MDSNRRPAGYEPAAIDQLSYVAIVRRIAADKYLVAGAGFEPRDLRVMSPTSYLAAPPRDMCLSARLYNNIRLIKICQPFFSVFANIFNLFVASRFVLCYNF